MPDQDSSVITATPDAGAHDTPSADWFAARRTTPEELETGNWAEQRTRDIEAHSAIKHTLGQDYDSYRSQLEGLSSEERASISGKDAEEIAEYLEEKADAEREEKRRNEEQHRRAEEQAEAGFTARETPQLREVRKAMKAAYEGAAALDERIAELQRLNNMREDLSAEEWDDLPAEYWRTAREGTMEGWDAEIANLIHQKQAKLQEAALHQSAYHEATRSIQPPFGPPSAQVPVGQIAGNDGQPVHVTREDIAHLVQIERDQQEFAQRAAETSRRHPDWQEAAQAAARAGVDVTAAQAQFIIALPNGPEVAYHLAKNHAETVAISRMSNQAAARELIRISHKLAAQGAPEPRRTTAAPKPPEPVGGSSARGFDVNDESLSADEWFHKRNADVDRRGRK